MTNHASQNRASDTADSPAPESGNGVRHLFDAAVCLALAVILFRAFQVEGYMISTGSMAPALLGFHKQVVCPSCRYPFAVGAVELAGNTAHAGDPSSTSESRTLRPIDRPATCPNCGQGPIDVSAVPRSQGDQLLVHKHAFLIEPPRRWEIAVFRNPYQPAQAYVKRIVGLPGESIQVVGGDVYVDGSIARKSLPAQRSIRIPVYDDSYRPTDKKWQPRWTAEPAETAWRATSDGFDLIAGRGDAAGGQEASWVKYEHLVRSPRGGKRQRLAAVADVYGYNGADDAPAEHVLRDLMISARLKIRGGKGEFVVEMTDGEQVVLCAIDRQLREIRLLSGTGGKTVRRARLAEDAFSPERPLHLEFSLFDRQALVAVNGRLPFAPWPLPELKRNSPPSGSPVRFGARGLTVRVSRLQLFRDVYYTRGKAINAVDEPYRLRDDQYFVLGDNSPVSLDARSWADGALEGRLLIGKPFLVHLPSKPGKVRIGRREAHFRIPDLSRIRYIR